MERTMTYSQLTSAMPEGLILSLMRLSSDMKIKVITLLSNSLCGNMPSEGIAKDETLDFPKLPLDFKVSESIRNIGKKFPEDFNYDTVTEEMYEEFAR